MNENIVKVGSVSGKIEAEILRGLLESNGIQVWLSTEAAATAIGLGVGPLAEVDLMVLETQVEQATQVIRDYRSGIATADD
ncbi:MAG TPA: DUF2007 domain-containing protein [Anaerolineae bacterium]|jgi:predicted thioredoxin/glutaredoxin|nr:DUF2007 domain-containing protein [Anaerolineae bacterium]